jgi:hypothetical protein
VVPAFAASAEFAIDKPAGHPCPHLDARFRCRIHDELRPRGFGGCAAFDCLGAGQQVTQITFGGRSWHTDPGLAGQMFEAFGVMRQLHEVLWYLAEAINRTGDLDSHLTRDLIGARRRIDALTGCAASDLIALDVAAVRRETGELLRRASSLVRSGISTGSRQKRHSMMGANLRGANLSGADLRGVSMVGADLRGADLRTADLLGTDLRGADLSGADLTACLFVLQSQVDSARGDAGTRLPAARERPAHWTT